MLSANQPGRPTRRRALLAGLSLTGLGTAGTWWWESRHVHLPLLSQTVAFTTPQQRELVPAEELHSTVPGSRVLAGRSETTALLRREQQWLAACAPWFHRADEFTDALRSAAADLYVLSAELPAAVAGWSPLWRYVWPRDVAAVAVALGLLGHHDDAWRQFDFLARAHRGDGRLQARYSPFTAQTPDDRTPQLDGGGWVMWGMATLWAQQPPPAARQPALLQLARDATQGLLAAIDPASGLPHASPDYWEVPERHLTIGTAAVVTMGLRQAAAFWSARGEPDLARRAGAAADRAWPALRSRFADLSRYGRGGGADAGLTFLLPPYVPGEPDPDVVSRLAAAEKDLRRRAGGLAPGASWKQDGVSWTPETALFALAHAWSDRPDRAAHWVHWLADHRTTAGSYPEKVLHDGSPAAVAPLAWTAALVVHTGHRLRVS